MKSWLIPVTIVALMIAGATAGAFASGGGDGKPADERGGTAHYEVVVRFNTLVEQGGIDATSDLLRVYDTGLDFIVQESWPPTGVANLQTETLNFCDTIINELSSRSYIEDFSCGPQRIFDGSVEDMPPVSSDVQTEPLDCSLEDDIDGCQDGVDSACEPVPLRSDCGIDPNVCNQVHNIEACEQEELDQPGDPAVQDAGPYRVVVSYNTSVTQPDLDETAEFLRGFDAGLEFLVQESWPPTGVANLQTDTRNFCDAIFDTLASQSYITDFSCNPQQIFNDVNEDVPVVNVNDLP